MLEPELQAIAPAVATRATRATIVDRSRSEARTRPRAITKIAVIGSAGVRKVLADGLLTHGYEVVRGTRDPSKLADWKNAVGPRASFATFADQTWHALHRS